MSQAGRFVWFDLITPKADEAQAFYTELFGWSPNIMEMPDGTKYRGMRVGEDYAGGGIVPRELPEGVPSHWIGYLTVDDVDAATKKAVAAGAQNVVEPMSMPEIGRFSVCIDPQGAVFAPYKAAGPQGEHDLSLQPGHFCWNELYSADVEQSKSFYRDLTGWSFRSQDMGGGMVYHMAQTGETSRAGLFNKPPEVPFPHWLPYVTVADVDGTADKAKTLGANVVHGPMDIPGVGRFAVMMDPVGAMLGFIKFAEQAGG
ncbi:MAG: VOC family protein [Deltaproteobacteria bacterium]|nr:VOC family protein [Deltaproteobacteria bacterium]